MKSEHVFYLFAGICLIGGGVVLIIGGPISLSFISLIFGVGSSVWGWRRQADIKKKQTRIDELIEGKSQIEEQLREERENKEAIREQKIQKNRRLSNLKQVLQRKGIDTEYLIEKYGRDLKAPLMVLTHFSAPRNNSEEEAKIIKLSLDSLDSKMLHGSARIIPPRNFDQSITSRDELEDWFDENVLDGRTDLTHKLEALSIVDIGQTFDRDASKDDDKQDFKTNTVSDLFETDTVIPTEDLVEILSRSDKISLEEELRQNVALLVVPNASKEQMEQVLEVQSKIENELGDVREISQTDTERIEDVFRQYDINDPESLGEGVQEEAQRIVEALD